MALDYNKWDKSVDLEGLQQDVAEAETNGGTGEYKEVPHGSYEVSVEKMELTESKNGDPMASIWFKIIAGDYKNSMIFYNQVITQGFQIHLVKELLKSMDTGIDIQFESYSQFAQLLLDVHEAVNDSLEFAINYNQNKKGYNTFKITDVYEVE